MFIGLLSKLQSRPVQVCLLSTLLVLSIGPTVARQGSWLCPPLDHKVPQRCLPRGLLSEHMHPNTVSAPKSSLSKLPSPKQPQMPHGLPMTTRKNDPHVGTLGGNGSKAHDVKIRNLSLSKPLNFTYLPPETSTMSILKEATCSASRPGVESYRVCSHSCLLYLPKAGMKQS